MPSSEITDIIKITKIKSGEFIEINQKRVQIRENQNGIMAVSYKAPLFETIELEEFFEGFNSSEKLKFNIGGTGSFGVNFRGIIDGREKNFSQNLDHKIILLEEYKCPKKEEFKFIKRYSRFVPRSS